VPTSISAESEATRITGKAPTNLKVLQREQLDAYERDGFISVEGLVDGVWIEKLRAVTAGFIEQSRKLDTSNRIFDLEPDHTPDRPRLRRLVSPADLHETYWEFVSQSVLVDLVGDLIGPDIKYHHGKLNFKAARGGEEVKWHQDIQFWPHTNYSPLTVGVFLSDVEPGMGNVGFIPGSHRGALFDQYAGDDWVGCLGNDDLERLDLTSAVFPVGPAGSVTVHNCRTVHGSEPNRSGRERPLLLQTYAAADAVRPRAGRATTRDRVRSGRPESGRSSRFSSASAEYSARCCRGRAVRGPAQPARCIPTALSSLIRRQRSGERSCAHQVIGNAGRLAIPMSSGGLRSEGRKRVPNTMSQRMMFCP
jgi:ectoine hydroxylase-related dioxygenase (phytanoyl-CoA dioxygenase family)